MSAEDPLTFLDGLDDSERLMREDEILDEAREVRNLYTVAR